jgi:integrase
MRGKELTATILNVKPPKKGKAEHFDSRVTGFGLRVTEKGRRAWFLLGRLNGKNLRLTIGRPGNKTIEAAKIYSLKDARSRAAELKGMLEAGIDPRTIPGWRGLRQKNVPAEETDSEHADGTVGALIDEWHMKHLVPNTRRANDHYRNARHYLKLWLNRQYKEITAADLLDITDSLIAVKKPGAANNAHESATRLFNWATDRRKIAASHFAGLKRPAKQKPRNPGRALSPGEIQKLWIADLDLIASAFVKILLLTGQRRGSVAGIRWSEIDAEARAWVIPASRMKNGAEHTIPLPDMALDVLNGLQRDDGGDYIFSTTAGVRPISGFSKIKRRIDGITEIGHAWTFHDLRRTVATEMAGIGIQQHVVEKLLDHRSGIVSGVAAIYNLHQYEAEVRFAVEAWALRLNEIVSGEARANTVGVLDVSTLGTI